MLLIAILVIFLILFSFYELCRKSGVNIAKFLTTFALKNISIALVAQVGIFACLSLNGVFLSNFVLNFDIPFMQNYIKFNNRWEHFRDDLVYVDYEHFRKAPLAKMSIYNNNELQMSCHFNRSELLYGSHEDDFTPHWRDTRYIGEDISIYYSFNTEGRAHEWFWMKDGHRVDTSNWRRKINDFVHFSSYIRKELQIYMLKKEDFGEYVLVQREVLEESNSSLSVIYDKYRYRFVLSEQEENTEYFEVPVGGLFALDFGRFYVLNGSNDLTLKHIVNSKLIERVPQSCLLSVFVYSLFYFRTVLQPIENIAPFSEEYWSNGMMRLVSVGCFSADYIGVHKIVIERCISFGKCSKCFNITHPTTHIISATSGSHPFSSHQTNESKTRRLLSKYFVDERTANMRIADSNRSAPFGVTPSGQNNLAGQSTTSGNDSLTELAHEWLKYYQQSEKRQYVKINVLEFLFVIFFIWIWQRFVWLVRLVYILLDMIPGHILEQSRRHLELKASKQEPQKTFEVFISYAPFCDEDYSFVVNKLYPVLNEGNVKVLLDREQSCTGRITSFYKWAVSVSRKMLMVVSDDYIDDDNGLFLQYESNILPKLRNKSISTEDVFIIKRDACLIPDSILNIENLRSMDWVEGNNEKVCLGTLKKWATRQNSCYQNAKTEVLQTYLKAVNILNNRFG